MILSSIVEEMRIFPNPFDLSACSFGRDAHTNYLDVNVKHVLMIKPLSSCNSFGDCFFHNLEKIFVKSFNYTAKDNPECSKNFE